MSKIVHDKVTDELLDMLALHAMDELDQAAAAELELHLAEGCEVCTEHLGAFRRSFAAVAHIVTAVHPPAEIRDRLLSEIQKSSGLDRSPNGDVGAQVWKGWSPDAAADVHVVRRGDLDWENVRLGVWAKRLYVDTERDAVTMLIRMDPGASWLPHRHGGPEQCFVLEGDLHDDDLLVTAGDFQCAAKGSVHGAQWTTSGCLLLIVSSLRDELLDEGSRDPQ